MACKQRLLPIHTQEWCSSVRDNSFVLSYLHHLCTDFCSGCKGSFFSTFVPAFVALLFIDNYFESNELESQTVIGAKRQGNLYKPTNLGERGRAPASVKAMANGTSKKWCDRIPAVFLWPLHANAWTWSPAHPCVYMCTHMHTPHM